MSAVIFRVSGCSLIFCPQNSLTAHPFFQFLSAFEKRKILGFYFDKFPGLRVSSSIFSVFLNIEGTQTPDFNSLIVGKRIRTVDIHCHSYVHDVWPLIEDHSDLGYLTSVVDNPILRKKIDINNVDFRLQQMDEQGIDVQALSLHVGQYHHWADADLAAKIVAVQNEKIAETCAAHPDRWLGR